MQKQNLGKDSSSQTGSVSQIYDEFCPILLNQFKSRDYTKFETFDASLDEFYSKIESQRSEQQQKAKENSAAQKLNKIRQDQDITLGVALGSATQIGMFAVPLCVLVAWIMGIKMDLNFNLLETGSLALAIIATSFTLQDGTSHYMKGLILLLCYVVIGTCFFVQRTPLNQVNVNNTFKSGSDAVLSA